MMYNVNLKLMNPIQDVDYIFSDSIVNKVKIMTYRDFLTKKDTPFNYSSFHSYAYQRYLPN